MRKLLLVLAVSLCAGCAQDLYYLSAPTVLPNVETEMKTPGFWVSRLDYPDQVIMAADEVQAFNREVVKSRLREDIAAFPDTISGKEVRGLLQQQFNRIAGAGYFTYDGRKAGKEYFGRIEDNLGLKGIPDTLNVAYAVVVSNADQRLLPTMEGLTSKPLDIDFDELQNSALDTNTPVAVLWQTADRLWKYVAGPSSAGWVLASNLAICSHDEIKRMRTNNFVVVTEAKADVFLDKERKRFSGFARMGTRFEARDFSDDAVEISLPVRDGNARLKMVPGYVRRKDVHRGYLPYTSRVVIEQAFEMLNTPYGWGGANGEQDCSQFLQEVFATVGIEIPRNSSAQANTGVLLYKFSENEGRQARSEKLLSLARPGLTLLCMNGHIMLYLGEVNKIPYAIHDTWAYRRKFGQKDEPMLVNKVTVSDLYLGQGSTKGTLLERLKSIRLFCRQ